MNEVKCEHANVRMNERNKQINKQTHAQSAYSVHTFALSRAHIIASTTQNTTKKNLISLSLISTLECCITTMPWETLVLLLFARSYVYTLIYENQFMKCVRENVSAAAMKQWRTAIKTRTFT